MANAQNSGRSGEGVEIPLRCGDVDLSPARAEDDELILRLFASTVADMLEPLGWSETQRREFVATQSAMQLAGYAQTHPDAQHLILLVDGRRLGRVIVESTAEAVELVDITLLAECRSAGFGSQVIRELQRRASEQQVPVRLSVRIDNERAIALYERLGFVADTARVTNSMYRPMAWPSGAVVSPS